MGQHPRVEAGIGGRVDRLPEGPAADEDVEVGDLRPKLRRAAIADVDRPRPGTHDGGPQVGEDREPVRLVRLRPVAEPVVDDRRVHELAAERRGGIHRPVRRRAGA
jgi:hypothetical protein